MTLVPAAPQVTCCTPPLRRPRACCSTLPARQSTRYCCPAPSPPSLPPSSLRAQDGEDPELAAALAASLTDQGGRPQSRAWGAAPGGSAAGAALAANDEEADLAAAIAASLADQDGGQPVQQARQEPQEQQQQQQQQQQQPGEAEGEAPQQPAQPAAAGQQQQEQAAAAPPPAMPALQLPELGAEPDVGVAGAVEVALRLPGGARVSRRFSAGSDTVGHLAAFAAAQGTDVAGCQLAAGFPRKVLEDWSASLAAAGVGHKELVSLEPRR